MANFIKKIRKRTGETEGFDSSKIRNAIEKAMKSVGELDEKGSGKITDEVVAGLNNEAGKFYQGTPGVEDIQDAVEEALSRNKKFERTAKAYMLYRRARGQARELRSFFGIREDIKFGVNAIRVLQERYLLKNNEGKIVESPTGMLKRVARAIAAVEPNGKDKPKWEEKFFGMMKNLEFLPNSPTLMNAGTSLGQLSACFVLPIEDSLEKIFDSLKMMAMIQQTGGGTGFSFSHIRPKGDMVRSTKGIASGPVSFMNIFNTATEIIKQGGKRRGANMGILHVSHPDIIEFIISKQKEKNLSNFNISVSVDDKFMEAVQKNKEHELISPRTGRVVKKMSARVLFEMICEAAWRTGDPGLLFADEANRHNQVPGVGKLEATNPCGEVWLLPYESCNLGSINLTKVVREGRIDYKKLKEIVWSSVRFLDNVVDANKYSSAELEKMALGNRRIGLGVMGFAEMLIMMEVPYESEKALRIAEELMDFVNEEAHLASQELGKERGNFPNFDKSAWEGKVKNMRNCACTTIAPTGTISIIAGCSSGIEPLFALAFEREVLSGKHLFETNKYLESELLRNNRHSDELLRKIGRQGNLKGIKLSGKLKSLFKTSLEIPLEQHIKMQAAFQRFTDNAVSKTINLPKDAMPKDIEKAYLQAFQMKCKGITIYRYGSKSEQVLYLGEGKKTSKATSEYAGGSCVGSVCTL
jgi:ribonucleoside-diphosphate reductase alpha chain